MMVTHLTAFRSGAGSLSVTAPLILPSIASVPRGVRAGSASLPGDLPLPGAFLRSTGTVARITAVLVTAALTTWTRAWRLTRVLARLPTTPPAWLVAGVTVGVSLRKYPNVQVLVPRGFFMEFGVPVALKVLQSLATCALPLTEAIGKRLVFGTRRRRRSNLRRAG